MIHSRPLTPAERLKSQYNYSVFAAINGLSYMCLGETVIILFAVKLNAPDATVAILGAMIYFGFVLLPLGKFVTARIGAAKSQASFWTMRNIAALIVATGSITAALGYQDAALCQVVTGAFLFYGFRAAGAVMGQPLLGEIVEDRDMGSFIGKSNGLFYVFSIIALLAICLVLAINDSIITLTGVIVVGSALGVTSARYINRIDETDALRKSAQQPWVNELRKAFGDSSLRRQMTAGFAINLAVIMLVPVSMLALKRGCGLSDTLALGFSLVQFSLAAAGSYLSGLLLRRYRARTLVIAGYWALLLIGPIWLLIPADCHSVLVLPFILAGGATITIANAMVHYFLGAVARERRVIAAMAIAVVTGVGAGVGGMLAAGSLLDFIARFSAEWEPLSVYRVYFATATLFLAALSGLVIRLR